jgi:hypothetical protein
MQDIASAANTTVDDHLRELFWDAVTGYSKIQRRAAMKAQQAVPDAKRGRKKGSKNKMPGKPRPGAKRAKVGEPQVATPGQAAGGDAYGCGWQW